MTATDVEHRRSADHPARRPVAPPPSAPAKPALWKRLLVWIIVLAALGVGGFYAWRFYQQSSNRTAAAGAARGAGRPTQVVAVRSHMGDLPIYLNALGNVAAYNTVALRTRVDGQLLKIHFSEGQIVHEGDLLFEIDPRPYQVQLIQAQGQVAKDEATLNNARQDLARYQAAAEAISRQQIDAAQAAVNSAEGTLKADQGAIDAANLNLAYTRISAPITGKIGLRGVDVGNMVHASDAAGLAVITQLQPISATFSISEDHLAEVQRAMAAGTLVAEAYDRDDQRRIATGKLEAIDNVIDPSTATVRLKAVFPNDDNALYPNQFVNIHLLVDTLRRVVLVPEIALQRSPTSTFLYVVTDTPPSPKEGAEPSAKRSGGEEDADNQKAGGRGGRGGRGEGRGAGQATASDQPPQYVEMRPVKVGPTEGLVSVIESGLQAGEVVVTDGVDKLQPGSAVIVHLQDEASASQPAGAGGRGGAATRSGRGRAGGRGTAVPGGAGPGTQAADSAGSGARETP